MAQTKQPIMSISENSSMVVKAALPDKDAAKMTLGRAAMVRVGGPQSEPLKLKVTRVYPSADPASRLVPIEIALPRNAKIAQGSFAGVSLVMERKDDAVLAPADAVIRKPGGKSMVFVVENGTAHARPVLIGIEAKGKAEVISGVRAGEMIAVRGQEMLKDGAEVKVKPQKQSPGEGMPGTAESKGPGQSGMKEGKR
jgi:HlyD family secretion protein